MHGALGQCTTACTTLSNTRCSAAWAQHNTAQHSTARTTHHTYTRTAGIAQGTVLDIRRALEAHPVYSPWLDWTAGAGQNMPSFQVAVAVCVRSHSCFVPTGKQLGRCLEYQYCPELVLGPSTVKAGSTTGQRGPTDMGRKSKNMN
jgi:hypothetical protein